MLVRKGGITREIEARRLPVYTAKGYAVVEEPLETPETITKTVDEMTVAELTAYAAEKGIDLTGITLKADILAKIKETEGGQ